MNSATKKLAKTSATSTIPALAAVLQTMSYHIASLMTDRPGPTSKSRMISFVSGLGGYGEGCPAVMFEASIIEATVADDPWGPWASVVGKNGQSYGNRCGAREALAAAYAPVIAWVAAYHVAKSVAATAA